MTTGALKEEREVGETRGKNIERQPDTMEKQVKGREPTNEKTNKKLEKSAKERGEQGSKIESHNSSQGADTRGRLIGKYKHKFFASRRKPEERVNTSTSRNRLSIPKLASISGTLVNTQTTKSGTRSRNIKICNMII